MKIKGKQTRKQEIDTMQLQPSCLFKSISSILCIYFVSECMISTNNLWDDKF